MVANTPVPEIVSLKHQDCPSGIGTCLAGTMPRVIWTLGNRSPLSISSVALFCSEKCPGNQIVKTYDFARQLRDNNIPVISGFHSSMEKECLDLLLRGTQPVVICPARSIEGMRIRATHREPLAAGRLLFVSPFPRSQRRPTKELAAYRNRFVAALAAKIFVVYAEPGGMTEALCKEVVGWGKPLFTFGDPGNENIIALGGIPIEPENAVERMNQSK